ARCNLFGCSDEIIADNLSKAGWKLGWRVGFGLRGANDLDCRMHTAMTENVLSCERMKADGVSGTGSSASGSEIKSSRPENRLKTANRGLLVRPDIAQFR